MDTDTINADIAILTGWTELLNGTGYPDEEAVKNRRYELAPDFCNDLNAIHKVLVEQVPDDKWDDFLDAIEESIPAGLRPQSYRKWAMTASAEVLARSFLKWKRNT